MRLPKHTLPHLLCGIVLAAAAPLSSGQDPVAPDAAGADFFEKRIRPVLAGKCYACHSAPSGKSKGGLSLDTRAAVLRGGGQGPALLPGNPDRSLLIRAIRRADDDLQMPPKESDRLSAEQVADFVAWVRMGAPDPRVEGPKPDRAGDRRSFWSFQPPRPGAVPQVTGSAWCRAPIDAFVLARLEARGLAPSGPADPRTLLRRVTVDLVGLPPSPEEIDAFLADESPDAYEKAVDRLLASPRYGERWGRHWLDVARYADTAGANGERYPHAHTYRDWVIRAFNEDLPFESFVLRQLAADRLPADGEDRERAALGFLTVGRKFPTVHDGIDDQIDVVTRGFLGLTVTCARCHDHKYDPIPTGDYYSLYGVFAASTRPKEFPLLRPATETRESKEYTRESGQRQEAVDAFVSQRHADLLKRLATAEQVSASLLALRDLKDLSAPRAASEAFKRGLHPAVLDRWKAVLAQPVFDLWRDLAARSTEEFREAAPERARRSGLFDGEAPASLAEVAARYGEIVSSDTDLRRALGAPGGPLSLDVKEIERHLTPGEKKTLAGLRKKVDDLAIDHPGAPARAMSLEDVPKPRPGQRIFKRGDPATPGDEVPRRFLECLSGADRPAFKEGSGRLELARAIASPVAARVWVNRVWGWHFGAGIVRTPSEFGTRGEPPTHPELLDWLTLRFLAEGGSTKKLHRLIVCSSVYRQAARGNLEGRAADPENRLLGRMDPQRLDFETLRDSLLAASGTLDVTMGGKPADLLAPPFSKRRTVYGLIDRQNLPEVFRSFDFADPDLHTAQRDETTVPQQSLFLMNNAFVRECARGLARRPEVAAEVEPARRIARMFRVVYGRDPASEEESWSREFLETAGGSWEKLAHVVLLASEFMFVE